MELYLVRIERLEGLVDVYLIYVRILFSIYDIAERVLWALFGIESHYIFIGGNTAFEGAWRLVGHRLCSCLDGGPRHLGLLSRRCLLIVIVVKSIGLAFCGGFA